MKFFHFPRVTMKLLATTFLLAALAIPAYGQSAMQKQGNSEESFSAVDSSKDGSDRQFIPTEKKSEETLATGTTADSSRIADGKDVSYSGGKVLFMKKICWLPFRRATYS